MLKNRTSTVAVISIFLMCLLIGQIFVTSKDTVAHAQAAITISFPDMTQLSPDGQKVVYVTAQDLSMVGSTIWLANADFSQATPLATGDATGESYWVTNPVWSPDGQKIAYVKAVKKSAVTDFVSYQYEIWAIQSNGLNNHLLTNSLFRPSLGYGGKTDLSWNVTTEGEEVEFSGGINLSYAVNVTTLAVHTITTFDSAALPYSANIPNVYPYSQLTWPWYDDIINNGNGCNLSIGSAGSAITAAAMVLQYQTGSTIQPDTVNNAMNGVGYDNTERCWIRWALLTNPFPSIEINDAYVWGPALTLENVQREIAGGVPLILWYYETYYPYTDKHFLVITGYEGSMLTIIDPSTGQFTNSDFNDYDFRGAVIIQKDQYFSKINPANDPNGDNLIDPDVDYTLEWNSLYPQTQFPATPVPVSYRYCLRKIPQKQPCDSLDASWTSAGSNTHVTVNLDGDSTYSWQVQANYGTGTTNKLTANGGAAWTFITGPAAATSTPTPTLTPTKTFTPTSTPTKTLTPTPTHPAFVTISGNITLNGAALSSVTINTQLCLDQTSCSSTPTYVTGANGTYSVQVPWDSVVVITPSKTGYLFTPASRSYATTQTHADITGQNFTAVVGTPTAIPTYTITGNVGVGNASLVVETCASGTCSEQSYSAGPLGNYSIPVPIGWTGKITPQLTGYAFTPSNKSYTNVQVNQTTQNYTAEVVYWIQGNVGIQGASISYTVNNVVKTVVSDGGGAYYLEVPSGWTGTITPSKVNTTFLPVSISYTNVLTNYSNQNFVITVTLKSIGAQDGFITESNETSGVGGFINDSSNVIRLGDDSLNRQVRAILSFTTASLPDGAEIQSAKLRIRQSGMPVGQDPFTVLSYLRLDMCRGVFGTLGTIELLDFSVGPTPDCVIPTANFNATPTDGWYSVNIPPVYLNFINVAGPTQFRLRFLTDDNNDGLDNYIYFVSGDNTINQPELTVTYTLTTGITPESAP